MDPSAARAARHDRLGEVDLAVEAWRSATEASPRDLGAFTRLVASLQRAGRLGEAHDLAARLVAAAPGAASTHATLSRARTLVGDAAGAAAAMADAARLAPDSVALQRAAAQAARRAFRAPERDAGVLSLIDRHVARHGWAVLGGPFAGLELAPPADARWGPLLWGIHEAELHPSIESLVASGPAWVVNIGGAEGYYAVGLARRLPRARVLAYESDPTRQATLAGTAARNGVAERVEIRGLCTVAGLAAELPAGACVVCDCEGAELWLLRPDRVPALRGCSVLVELHDFLFAGITGILQRRFGATHDVTLIDAVDDRPAPPDPRGLPDADIQRLLAEHRPRGMQWAWMRPRAPGG